MSNLSVAIVTRNRCHLLKFCLDSLVKQKTQAYEILVIDNASTDSTKEIVTSFNKTLPIKYLYEERIGIPNARNRALIEANGDILAFIDDDCEAHSDWIGQMIISHNLYPNAAAILGSSRSLFKKGAINKLSQIYNEKWVIENVSKENGAVIFDTKNISIKKRHCSKITFDPSFLRGSDVDFGYQLLERKKEIIYWPKAKIYFRARNNILDFLNQRYLIGVSSAQIEFKWKEIIRIPYEDLKHVKDPLYEDISRLILVLDSLAQAVQKFGNNWEKIKILHDYKRLDSLPSTGVNKPLDKNRKLSLSIMIITKDRYRSLNKCLLSLSKQTLKPNQVVIVDSSIRKNPKFIDKFLKKLPITYISENRVGFGTQRNIALKYTTGDIGAIIDDDAEAKPDWCEKIVEAHMRYSEALAIQGRIFSRSKSFIIRSLEQARRDNWILRNLDSSGSLFILTGNNSSYKLGLLRRYNIKFAQDILHDKYDGEDVDLANQILLKNHVILLVPDIVVNHSERKGFFPFLKQRYRIGCSTSIISRDWSMAGFSKKLFERNLPGYLRIIVDYLLDIFFHPLFKKNFFHIVTAWPIFYLARLANYKGRLDIKKILKSHFDPPDYLLRQRPVLRDNSLSVVVINEKVNALESCLLSLVRQTVYPLEIIILDNRQVNITKKIVMSYQKILPVRYLCEFKGSSGQILNNALDEAKGKIVSFIDSDSVVSPDWVWRMLEEHLKNPKAVAIQGLSVGFPKNRVISFIANFLDNYSFSVLKGKHSDLETLDNLNVSFKLSLLRDLGLRFDSKMNYLEGLDLAKKMHIKKQTVRFNPKIFTFHYERNNLILFLVGGFRKGVGFERYRKKWYRRRRLKMENFIGSTKIFITFCRFSKISLRLSLFLVVFFFYRGVFHFGRLYESFNSK